MKQVSSFKGINGQLKSFKDEVENAEKIIYAGVPGVCTPFAELLAYAVRDKKNIFIPDIEIEKAREMKLTDYGVELGSSIKAEGDVLVLLGGLAMPRIGSEVSEVKEFIEKLVKNKGKVMGVCFMDMFRKAGWDQQIDFDSIINADIEGYILE